MEIWITDDSANLCKSIVIVIEDTAYIHTWDVHPSDSFPDHYTFHKYIGSTVCSKQEAFDDCGYPGYYNSKLIYSTP